MFDLFSFLDPITLGAALGIAVLAGTIKGMVGFAMPMILISGLGTFLSPEVALAGLILPTVVTNGMQALEQGWRAARDSILRFSTFLIIGLVCLLASAQTLRFLPRDLLFLMIGGPITLFALLQLVGWQLRLRGPSRRAEAIIGGIAGAIGGVSGIWGPPTVAYLTAINTEKSEQMRVQGVIYGLGAVALVFAHLGSGILTAQTATFSAVLIVPAVAGMWVGARIRGGIDQVAFRRATLIVLFVAGLNLIRRGLGF